jgi:hypothetical protein
MKKYFPCFILLATVHLTILSGAQAALPCSLSAEDYKSLAQTDPPLTPESTANLPEAGQKNLCAARALLQRVRSSPDPMALANTMTIADIPPGLSHYLSPAEYNELRPVTSRVMTNDMMKANFPNHNPK